MAATKYPKPNKEKNFCGDIRRFVMGLVDRIAVLKSIKTQGEGPRGRVVVVRRNR